MELSKTERFRKIQEMQRTDPLKDTHIYNRHLHHDRVSLLWRGHKSIQRLENECIGPPLSSHYQNCLPITSSNCVTKEILMDGF